MDREMLTQHLRVAERDVAEGERHVLRQLELIAALERDGHDTAQAVQLLRQFEELQEMHVADPDRLRKETGLARFGARPPFGLHLPDLDGHHPELLIGACRYRQSRPAKPKLRLERRMCRADDRSKHAADIGRWPAPKAGSPSGLPSG